MHELVHRHQLDGGDPEPLEVLDHRRVGQAGVGAADVLRDPRVPLGHALDVRLVDDRLVERDAQRAVVGPVEERVDHHRAHRVRRRVGVVVRLRVAEPVGEQRLVPLVAPVDRLRVRVEQQLVRVAAQPAATGRTGRAPGSRTAGRARPAAGSRARPAPRAPAGRSGSPRRRRRTGTAPPARRPPRTARSSCRRRRRWRPAGTGSPARFSSPHRLPDDPGGRRVDAQPGRHVDHHEHVHRARGSGPGRSGCGARWSALSMAARARCSAGVLVARARLAVDLLDQRTGRASPRSCSPRGSSRVAVAARAASTRSASPGAHPAGLGHVRDHRGPGAGLDARRRSSAVSCSARRALAGLLRYEPRRAEPLIDLRFFRSAPFSGATLIAVCAFAALGGFLFLNTLYLQDARGLSAAARRPLHAADGRHDGRVRAALRPPGRRARHPAAADRWPASR